MRLAYLLLVATSMAARAADKYYSISMYAPDQLQLDGKVINAVDGDFVTGTLGPTADCDLFDPKDCPPGNATLVNADMTTLAAAVPGGQFIYVSPDGSITYSAAHSTRRPAGAQMGGFSSYQTTSRCGGGKTLNVFTWESDDGASGLWLCQASPNTPIGKTGVLKASTKGFAGAGCLSVQALQAHEMGTEFGAWVYT